MTSLEVVDTAIKIGLGALISGVATYFTIKASNKHDIQKIRMEDKKGLVLKIIDHLDRSATCRDDAIASLVIKKKSDINDINKEIQLYSNALSDLRSSRSIAFILGNEELAKLIIHRFITIENEYRHLYDNKINYDVEYLDRQRAERSENNIKIYANIEKEMNRIYKY